MGQTTIRDAFAKSPYRSIKHSSYFAVYEKLLAPYRNKPITFVEIGVLGGGSLFMWREFFGPEARIIGVDLNPKAKRWEEHGFEIFVGNQADPNFWREFVDAVKAADVVLDDGGHTFEQQIVTVEALMPIMKDGGMLMVEDTHTSYDREFGGPSRYSFVEYAKNRVDGINYRSSMLDKKKADNETWGISFFESFVIFHVDRVESRSPVKLISNGGIDDSARDHRYADSRVVGQLGRLLDNFPSLASDARVKKLRANGGIAVRWLVNQARNRRLKPYRRF